MSDQLEYWVSRSESEPIVQNNKYLLPIVEVKMHQMSGQFNRVPKFRKDDKNGRENGTAKSSILFGI